MARVIGASEHDLFTQATLAPLVDVDQQGTPAVVIDEQVDYKPK